MRILFITTGGTIDKVYFDRQSTYQVGDSHIEEVLKAANVTFPYEIVALMRKDSLDLTAADREQIRAAVAGAAQRHIVVTHGTDTMVETARLLQSVENKVVVLTGAMHPANFRVTDAVFNIAAAATAVQLLPTGVYICMNGQLFDPCKVRKNRLENRFEPI